MFTLPLGLVFGAVPAVAPRLEELVTPLEGAAPIAVVPVDGVMLPRLPGVVGPESVLELPADAFGVAPAMVLPCRFVEADADGPVPPSVDEPSVDDEVPFEPLVLPQGCVMPGLAFCARAAPVHATSAAAPQSCTSRFVFMCFSFRFQRPVGGRDRPRVQ